MASDEVRAERPGVRVAHGVADFRPEPLAGSACRAGPGSQLRSLELRLEGQLAAHRRKHRQFSRLLFPNSVVQRGHPPRNPAVQEGYPLFLRGRGKYIGIYRGI